MAQGVGFRSLVSYVRWCGKAPALPNLFLFLSFRGNAFGKLREMGLFSLNISIVTQGNCRSFPFLFKSQKPKTSTHWLLSSTDHENLYKPSAIVYSALRNGDLARQKATLGSIKSSRQLRLLIKKTLLWDKYLHTFKNFTYFHSVSAFHLLFISLLSTYLHPIFGWEGLH